MAKMTIIEGNSNDKDNTRAYMVKGERGYSSYELYVKHGGTLTEEEWLDAFLNADNYYDKSETDALLDDKADASDVYTKAETDLLCPTGSISIYAGTTAPTGYLLCDGSAVSRSIYSELFGVIGTTYGSGDEETTFNLPNLKGKVPVGYDSSDTDFDTLGETGGEKEHTLTVNELPTHSHEQFAVANPSSGGTGIRGTYNEVEGSGMSRYSTNTQTGITGEDEPHNNLQPYVVMNYIIKY